MGTIDRNIMNFFGKRYLPREVVQEYEDYVLYIKEKILAGIDTFKVDQDPPDNAITIPKDLYADEKIMDELVKILENYDDVIWVDFDRTYLTNEQTAKIYATQNDKVKINFRAEISYKFTLEKTQNILENLVENSAPTELIVNLKKQEYAELLKKYVNDINVTQFQFVYECDAVDNIIFLPVAEYDYKNNVERPRNEAIFEMALSRIKKYQACETIDLPHDDATLIQIANHELYHLEWNLGLFGSFSKYYQRQGKFHIPELIAKALGSKIMFDEDESKIKYFQDHVENGQSPSPEALEEAWENLWYKADLA